MPLNPVQLQIIAGYVQAETADLDGYLLNLPGSVVSAAAGSLDPEEHTAYAVALVALNRHLTEILATPIDTTWTTDYQESWAKNIDHLKGRARQLEALTAVPPAEFGVVQVGTLRDTRQHPWHSTTVGAAGYGVTGSEPYDRF